MRPTDTSKLLPTRRRPAGAGTGAGAWLRARACLRCCLRCCLPCCLCACLCILAAGAAAAQSLPVLYPDLGEPYRKVFAEIVQGVEEQTHAKARSFLLGAAGDTAELRGAIKNSGSKVVIALGRQGLKAATALDGSVAVVVGGVSGVSAAAESERLSGISLAPDPALLFALLKNLLPGVRRVLVVCNPQNNATQLRLAREAARALGLELAVLEAGDLASAAGAYEMAMAGADGRRDALWLPQDASTVDEGSILPYVLKESWERRLPLFSSSALHVKKGALFALYPDNVQLGRDLAGMALAMQAAGMPGAAAPAGGLPPKRGMQPLRAVRAALNTRTASHLGVQLVSSQQRSFDLIYPEP